MIDRPLARRIAALIVVGFLAFLAWRLFERRGSEVDLVYDFSRVGRTDLIGLEVALRRGADVVRQATFRYLAREGSAPITQRHRVRLADGSYEVDLVLRFAKGPDLRFSLPLTLPRDGDVILPVAPPR
jgi:hypothetical protein